jgi:hypothetical protein
VYGDGSVTITTSDGAVLAPTKNQLRPVTYAKVAALQQPNTLIAIGKQSIQRSSDAGCSWQQIDKSPDDLYAYSVAPGAGDAAYLYGVNDQPIHRVKGNQVSTVAGPVEGGGLAAFAATTDYLRVVAGDGQVFDSADDGLSWKRVGQPAASSANSTTSTTASRVSPSTRPTRRCSIWAWPRNAEVETTGRPLPVVSI